MLNSLSETITDSPVDAADRSSSSAATRAAIDMTTASAITATVPKISGSVLMSRGGAGSAGGSSGRVSVGTVSPGVHERMRPTLPVGRVARQGRWTVTEGTKVPNARVSGSRGRRRRGGAARAVDR